jgi:hypothetical protein
MKPQPKSKNRKPAATSSLGAMAPMDQTFTPFVPTSEAVAQRAYHNYQNHGASDGNDVEDWLRAESELVAEQFSSGRC